MKPALPRDFYHFVLILGPHARDVFVVAIPFLVAAHTGTVSNGEHPASSSDLFPPRP